uniref:40S ribosomal protein S30 n=2 Tax=Canis lupus familiaris TaxID=9615 RepID=A0A8C0THR6_CANLF
MQLFVRAQELHTLEVTGQGMVAQIKALTTLEVASRMLGGKVHGSLACAGKVRGQTPKVAEQEKKKKTGRAKRQMQYNRRFVNVVPTFGKKKGPNANS